MSRNRHDVSRLLRCIPECLADQEDLLRQVPFFNDDVRPDGPEQFVLRDHAIAVLDQEDQRIERLGHQWHRCPVADQEAHLLQQREFVELPTRTGGDSEHDVRPDLTPTATIRCSLALIDRTLPVERRPEGIREIA